MRSPLGAILSLLIGVSLMAPPPAAAAGAKDILEALIRAGRKVGRAAPDGKIAKGAKDAARAGRKAGEAASEGRVLQRIDELSPPRINARTEAQLARRFDRLDNVDDNLRHLFNELPAPQRALVVELGEASQRVMRRTNGEELIRQLDADGLRQVGTYGDTVIEGVEQLGPGFKDAVRKTGNGALVFYGKYLKPHRGKLAAAGLVTAYLAAPEKFHDAAGKLTERAVEEFAKLGIETTGAVHRGLWRGVQSKLSATPVSSSLGILTALCCLALAIPRVRWAAWRKVRFLFTTPDDKPKKTATNRPTKPLYEE